LQHHHKRHRLRNRAQDPQCNVKCVAQCHCRQRRLQRRWRWWRRRRNSGFLRRRRNSGCVRRRRNSGRSRRSSHKRRNICWLQDSRNVSVGSHRQTHRGRYARLIGINGYLGLDKIARWWLTRQQPEPEERRDSRKTPNHHRAQPQPNAPTFQRSRSYFHSCPPSDAYTSDAHQTDRRWPHSRLSGPGLQAVRQVLNPMGECQADQRIRRSVLRASIHRLDSRSRTRYVQQPRACHGLPRMPLPGHLVQSPAICHGYCAPPAVNGSNHVALS
jgi:hypothetical protein